MNSNILGEKDGFLIRLAKAEDAAGYFEQNFCPLDQEVVRLTGCKEEFTKDEVVSFFMKSLKDDERYFFLIIAPDGSIIGESIINEIDWDLRCANFRIALFHSIERGKGIGTWATELTRDYALGQKTYVLSAFLFNIAQKPLFPIIEWIAGTPFDTGCLLI